MRASELQIEQSAVITAITLPKEQQLRLFQLGIQEGTILQLVKRAPLHDPLLFQVQDSWIAIRRSDARNIIVERIVP